ncbi:hypothetical protein N7494_012941 [Penicillium frequentans]|uniref:Uncharacterized protein n=1 Tax=Penicillium frequentans TaxID=3151616 RepID=A0AAD6CN25_9EURO|nr:hypothetical protein N7494_012941 [Penicillium glabrum]
MTITIPEEYAELMKHNRDGHYLYTPQSFSQLHPGAVGFFDEAGDWNLITDLSIPGRPEEDGFTAPKKVVTYEKPKEKIWKTTSSSKEAEASFGLSGGLSGALSSAPIDVSAEAKNKWGQTGKAALITDDSVVVNEWLKAPCRDIITDWVEKNAKELVKGEWSTYIKDFGLWAIKKTWSTQECAITMESAHSRDTSGGFDVGATGIAKVGTNASSNSKTNSEGWRTYKATEEDKGLVVSYGGAAFRLHKVSMFHRNPLKQTERTNETVSAAVQYPKPVYDENGNQIGEEYYRAVFNENGEVVGEEKVDVEAERKAEEEKEKRLQEEMQKQLEEQRQQEDEFVFQAGDVVGEDDDEAEAEEEAVRALAEERKAFKENVMMISQNASLTEEQKKKGLAALLAANATETTETVKPVTMTTTVTPM